MDGRTTAIIVTVCALFISTTSGSVGIGRCPEKTAMKQFDISKYAGRWYEISSFGAYFEFNGKCVQAVYTPQGEGVEVLNAMIDKLTLKVRHIKGSAVPEDSSGDAKLSVTFPLGWVNRTGPYWVLDTDYDNYSLVYACRDIVVAHYEVGWILSRKPTLDADIKAKVDSIITANKLRPSQYSPTEQTCGVIDCSTEPCKITPP